MRRACRATQYSGIKAGFLPAFLVSFLLQSICLTAFYQTRAGFIIGMIIIDIGSAHQRHYVTTIIQIAQHSDHYRSPSDAVLELTH